MSAAVKPSLPKYTSPQKPGKQAGEQVSFGRSDLARLESHFRKVRPAYMLRGQTVYFLKFRTGKLSCIAEYDAAQRCVVNVWKRLQLWRNT